MLKNLKTKVSIEFEVHKKNKQKKGRKTSGSKRSQNCWSRASSRAALPLAGGQEGAGHQEVTTWT